MNNLTHLRAMPQKVPVATLAPFDDTPRQTFLRERIAMARDLGTRAIGRWPHHSEPARICFGLIVDVATANLYARVTEDELTIARQTCLLLLQAASTLDAMQGVA